LCTLLFVYYVAIRKLETNCYVMFLIRIDCDFVLCFSCLVTYCVQLFEEKKKVNLDSFDSCSCWFFQKIVHYVCQTIVFKQCLLDFLSFFLLFTGMILPLVTDSLKNVSWTIIEMLRTVCCFVCVCVCVCACVFLIVADHILGAWRIQWEEFWVWLWGNFCEMYLDYLFLWIREKRGVFIFVY
jgi:hypothetical protein